MTSLLSIAVAECGSVVRLLMKAKTTHPLSHVCSAVGDIHGQLPKLLNLWSNLEQSLGPAFSTATVIFLGDYNDRGPQVGGVIDWLVFLDKRYPKQKHVFLAGNHDFSFAGEVSASMSYFRESARHQCLCFFSPPGVDCSESLRPLSSKQIGTFLLSFCEIVKLLRVSSYCVAVHTRVVAYYLVRCLVQMPKNLPQSPSLPCRAILLPPLFLAGTLEAYPPNGLVLYAAFLGVLPPPPEGFSFKSTWEGLAARDPHRVALGGWW
jgi:hypothetical protein